MGQHSDPGGYPCHDHAVTILRYYQSRTRKTLPKCQAYFDWRAVWMLECLRLMRPWDMTLLGTPATTNASIARLIAETEILDAPPVTFSGF
jgi:hypothetical protein